MYEPTLHTGDFIELSLDQGVANRRLVRGRILGIYRKGQIPELDRRVTGTPENPAIHVEIYTETNGRWLPTGAFTGIKMRELVRTLESQRK